MFEWNGGNVMSDITYCSAGSHNDIAALKLPLV